MAEFIPVSLIKNNLTECPICTEQFEEEVRIPRRMPCCVQSICQPCLETYSKGQTKVSCPMCRCEHLLPGGVSSLAKEPLILRILDQLKIQKGVKIPCTDCPDKNDAVARCEDCCISLCEECLRAHRRISALKIHNVKTFEELKGLPVEDVKRVHKCEEHHHPLEFYCTTCDKVICVSCTVLEHEKGDNHNVISVNKAHKDRSEKINTLLTKLDKKEKYLTESVRKLELERDMFKESGAKAKEKVTFTFDSLIEVLELKKATLLSQLDHKMESYLKNLEDTTEDAKTILTQVRSSSDYTRNMRRKADKIEDIQLTSSSLPSLKAVHEKQVIETKSIDIEKEVDASKELIDMVNLYLQEHSYVGKTCQDKSDFIPHLVDDVDDFYYKEDPRMLKVQEIAQFDQMFQPTGAGYYTMATAPVPVERNKLKKGDFTAHLVDDVDDNYYKEGPRKHKVQEIAQFDQMFQPTGAGFYKESSYRASPSGEKQAEKKGDFTAHLVDDVDYNYYTEDPRKQNVQEIIIQEQNEDGSRPIEPEIKWQKKAKKQTRERRWKKNDYSYNDGYGGW